jgi:hypothetical protein
VVANIDRIAGEAKHIFDASGISQKKVSLESQTVAITTSYLNDRLATAFLHQQTAPQGRKTHHRALMVSDIDSVNLVFEEVYAVNHLRDVCSLRGPNLCGYQEPVRIEFFFKQ